MNRKELPKFERTNSGASAPPHRLIDDVDRQPAEKVRDVAEGLTEIQLEGLAIGPGQIKWIRFQDSGLSCALIMRARRNDCSEEAQGTTCSVIRRWRTI